MQVCTSLQTDNHASTPPLRFFYRPDALPAPPTNRVKALKASAKTKYAVKTTTGDSEDESMEAVPA